MDLKLFITKERNNLVFGGWYLVFILALFITTSPACGGDKTNTNFIHFKNTHDDIQYGKLQLLNAFLNASIARDRLNEEINITTEPSFEEFQELKSQIRVEYPWLYPHLYPDQGLPRDMAIHKWTQPVKISFGMPNDLQRFQKTDNSKYGWWLAIREKSEKEKPSNEILNNLTDFTNNISKIAALPVNVLLPERETLANYGKVRIIFVKNGHFKRGSRFRGAANVAEFGIGQDKPLYFHSGLTSLAKHKIKTGFYFSRHPHNENQVEGFFVSNGDNEIQMSFCFIWDGHSERLEKALIQECILRSMGIPGNAGGPDSLLSPWNNQEAWGRPEYKAKIDTPPANLSDFDRQILSLLYRPELKPGMNFYDVQKELLERE